MPKEWPQVVNLLQNDEQIISMASTKRDPMNPSDIY
jgi:hypothetical protein